MCDRLRREKGEKMGDVGIPGPSQPNLEGEKKNLLLQRSIDLNEVKKKECKK